MDYIVLPEINTQSYLVLMSHPLKLNLLTSVSQTSLGIHESFIPYTFRILANENFILPELTCIYFSNYQPEMNYLLFIDIKSRSGWVWECIWKELGEEWGVSIIKIQDIHAWNSKRIYENDLLTIGYLSHSYKAPEEHGTSFSLTDKCFMTASN